MLIYNVISDLARSEDEKNAHKVKRGGFVYDVESSRIERKLRGKKIKCDNDNDDGALKVSLVDNASDDITRRSLPRWKDSD